MPTEDEVLRRLLKMPSKHFAKKKPSPAKRKRAVDAAALADRGIGGSGFDGCRRRSCLFPQ